METLKDPAMVLGITNTVGMVGITAYFYKQNEALRADLNKLSQTMQGVLRKLSEMDKAGQNKTEVLHTLNDQIKVIETQLKELPSPDSFEDVNNDIDEIIDVLNNNNISVERPSSAPRRRSGDRKVSRREEEERREAISSRRQPVRSGERVPRSLGSTSRDTGRHTRAKAPEPEEEYEEEDAQDDEDLIAAVRGVRV